MATNPTGVAILAAARKCFDEAPLLFVDVPEWPDTDGKPTRIWYRSVISLSDVADIARLADEGRGDFGLSKKDARHQHSFILIRHALDQNGKPLFSKEDADALLALGADVVMRITATFLRQFNLAKPANE